MTDTTFEVRDIHKRFGALEVLKGISLAARDGDVISIIGASGSGKSTLLRCINMLEVPDAGEIRVAGEDVVAHAVPLHEVELLEDHPRLAAEGSQAGTFCARHVAAEDRDLPLGGVDEPVDAAQERRLARAGEPEDGEELPFAHLERDVVERPYPVGPDLREPLDGDCDPRGHFFPSRFLRSFSSSASRSWTALTPVARRAERKPSNVESSLGRAATAATRSR